MFHRFRQLRLKDAGWVQRISDEDGSISGHIGFASMFLCQYMYNDTFAKYKKCLIKKPGRVGSAFYCQYPIGKAENRKKAAKALYRKYHRGGEPFVFFALTGEEVQEVREVLGRDVLAEMQRNDQNYILSASEQIELPGSRFADRRNKLKRFDRTYQWTYSDMTKEEILECRKVNQQWYEAHDKNLGNVDGEQAALEYGFQFFDELGFEGGVLRVEGEPVAFCIGTRFNSSIYLMLFQKSKPGFRDASIVLNHEFYQRHCREYEYINYSEDMGVEGLRKFKQMMHPVFLTDFYNVTILP